MSRIEERCVLAVNGAARCCSCLPYGVRTPDGCGQEPRNKRLATMPRTDAKVLRGLRLKCPGGLCRRRHQRLCIDKSGDPYRGQPDRRPLYQRGGAELKHSPANLTMNASSVLNAPPQAGPTPPATT